MRPGWVTGGWSLGAGAGAGGGKRCRYRVQLPGLPVLEGAALWSQRLGDGGDRDAGGIGGADQPLDVRGGVLAVEDEEADGLGRDLSIDGRLVGRGRVTAFGHGVEERRWGEQAEPQGGCQRREKALRGADRC